MTGPKELRRKMLAEGRGGQARLAKTLGVQEPMISKLMAGSATPSLQLALRIKKALGIDPGAWAR